MINDEHDEHDEPEPQDRRPCACGGEVTRKPWWDEGPEFVGSDIGTLEICDTCDYHRAYGEKD